jgi:hypothetical protein
MYMCLWKEVTDAADKAKHLNEMMNFARSNIPALAQAARVHIRAARRAAGRVTSFFVQAAARASTPGHQPVLRRPAHIA